VTEAESPCTKKGGGEKVLEEIRNKNNLMYYEKREKKTYGEGGRLRQKGE